MGGGRGWGGAIRGKGEAAMCTGLGCNFRIPFHPGRSAAERGVLSEEEGKKGSFCVGR